MTDGRADLGPGQKPVVMHHYPHMMTEDAVVWSSFLEQHGSSVSRVWYDVKVGQPIQLGPDATEAQRRLAEGTGCKRIDVVALVGTRYWVVEVKPYGNYVAVGQALTYLTLFREKFGQGPSGEAVVVCGVKDPDVENTARLHGCRVIEVGAVA